MKSNIRTIYWNVYIKHNKDHVLKELKNMASEYQPELFGLAEARGIYTVTDDVPGYNRVQLKPQPGAADENANIAVLVRNDVEVISKRPMRMRMRFRGPKAGINREPRIYWNLKIRVEGQVWRVSVGHWPFGPAKQETKKRIKKWFGRSLLPSTHIADVNTRPAELTKMLKGTKIRHKGIGIDRALYKNCSATVKGLGKRGSDHTAVLFTFWK